MLIWIVKWIVKLIIPCAIVWMMCEIYQRNTEEEIKDDDTDA